MNIEHLQATLRHFAAERDWQPFHTPKNLVMALMVEAAELAEVFQWMTPEESSEAHADASVKERIGEELADVLLYLLQVADHTKVDLAQAVQAKLRRNAEKYPAKRTIVPALPQPTHQPDTHILLDYENVQPTEIELRAIVPEASRVWVFHGPHQKSVEQRFASFGTGMTPVPISKTGKNALDFHLAFYTGYIFSRSPNANIVVVANDKGYEPMLAHAKAMGFAVRQQGHALKDGAAALPMAKVVAAAQPVAKKVAAKKTAAKKAVAKKAATKKVAVKKMQQPAAKKSSVGVASEKQLQPPAVLPPGGGMAKVTDLMLRKMTDSLRKMGEKRPAKHTSLRRAAKPILGIDATDESIGILIDKLTATAVVAIDDSGAVTYPQFRIPKQ